MLYLHATTVILSIRGSVHAVINIRSLDFAVNCFLMKLCAERLISTLLKMRIFFFQLQIAEYSITCQNTNFLFNHTRNDNSICKLSAWFSACYCAQSLNIYLHVNVCCRPIVLLYCFRHISHSHVIRFLIAFSFCFIYLTLCVLFYYLSCYQLFGE